MLHVPPVIFLFFLDTPHSFWQVSIISNVEGCTLCKTSNGCARFVRNIRNDFLNHQLDLQALFRALNVRPHKHMVQCDPVKGACNVTSV